jgi:hypothetical protein
MTDTYKIKNIRDRSLLYYISYTNQTLIIYLIINIMTILILKLDILSITIL